MHKPRPLIKTTRPRAPDQEATKADYQSRLIATPKPLSTIQEVGAHQFVHSGHSVLFSCHRTHDMEKITEVFGARGGTPGFSFEKTYLGLRVYCNERHCALYLVPGENIVAGERYSHVLLKDFGRPVMVSISLSVRPVEKPCNVTVTTNIRMKAALEVFNTSVKRAEGELAKEIARIMEIDRHERQAKRPGKTDT